PADVEVVPRTPGKLERLDQDRHLLPMAGRLHRLTIVANQLIRARRHTGILDGLAHAEPHHSAGISAAQARDLMRNDTRARTGWADRRRAPDRELTRGLAFPSTPPGRPPAGPPAPPRHWPAPPRHWPAPPRHWPAAPR